MGIFNDNMYTEEEVKRIKELYREIGWLLRDFEIEPEKTRSMWKHNYFKKGLFEEWEYKIMAREMTKSLQSWGYNYEIHFYQDEFFDVLYAVEANKND